MKFKISENEYINVNDDNSIEIKTNSYELKFDSLREMVDSFKPGVLRTFENNKRLSEMKFEDAKLMLYRATVYDEYVEEFVIVARSQEEADLLFDNYLNENYYDVEYEGVFEFDGLDCYDDEEFEEICKEYTNRGIGVFDWCGL